jgi:Stage II sporulation protein E (SpoIIE)
VGFSFASRNFVLQAFLYPNLFTLNIDQPAVILDRARVGAKSGSGRVLSNLCILSAARVPMLRVRLLLLLLLPLSAFAAPAVDKPKNDDTASVDSFVHVKLGESSIGLAGPWKFHIGDDPAWAQPDFDDSKWEDMDLTPGSRGLARGWTARGHAGYSGYAWYRLQVEVWGANRSLALKMPGDFDDAYQVFVNGQRLGEFGKFTPHGVTAYSALPTAFRLPKSVRDGKVTIAIRMWMDSATPFNFPDAGGLHEPPELGYASAISSQVRLDWDDVGHQVGSGFLELLILVMSLLIALALFWLDRQEKSYLWLALVCEATILSVGVLLLVNFTTWIGQTEFVILTDVIAKPLQIGLWVLFWGYWFRLERIRALHRAVWFLVVILAVGTAMLRPPLYGAHVPVHAGTYLEPFLLVVKLGLGALLLLVAYRGFKRNKEEGVMAAVAVLLAVIAIYNRELRLIHVIHVPTTFNWLGFDVNLGTLSTTLSLLIITVMLLRRFIIAQRTKEQWKMEIAQARHVQQVLIPNELPQLNDLRIDSVYRPAREVGGDFFQIVPNEKDGTSLIAFGDVTGKGLQAGMLVALIIGAIRAAAEHDNNPQRMLEVLNEQLCERESASATCMVLRFSEDGVVELGNAGQLPPYLNGVEMQIEGALPLGILSGMDFPVTSFKLEPGDSLLIMSDGIAEAQNAHGELFGFERIEQMLRDGTTTTEIAAAAQKFGQTDDILVLRVERNAAQTALHTQPQEVYS